MKSRAGVLTWGVVAMACAGVAVLGSAQEEKQRPIPIYKTPSEAPLFAAYYLRRDEDHGGGGPEKNVHYEECRGDCSTVVFRVEFDARGCPTMVTPAKRNWMNCIDPNKGTGNSPTTYELTCTAMKHGTKLAFANGARRYEVRFAPFGEPITVAGGPSKPHAIWNSAPTAWYKFTVYVLNPNCSAFDPNVIVTD